MTNSAPLSNDDARADFLRKLPASGFVPPDFGAPALSPGLAAVRAAVDSFGRRFWSLPPTERRTEWQVLVARSADDPQSAHRLSRLEQFLNCTIQPVGGTSPEMVEIEKVLLDLATLAPPESVRRRAMFLRELSRPLVQWQKAAVALRDRRPETAALDCALIDRLATLGAGTRWPPRMLPDSFQELTTPAMSMSMAEAVDPSASTAPRKPVPQPATKTAVVVMIALAMMVFRNAIQSSGRDSGSPRPIRPLPQIHRQSKRHYERSEDLEKKRIWLEELEKMRFGPPPKLDLPPSPQLDTPTTKPPS